MPYANVQVCESCWRIIEGDRVPHRVVDPPTEECGRCGKPTHSGIYVRMRVVMNNIGPGHD